MELMLLGNLGVDYVNITKTKKVTFVMFVGNYFSSHMVFSKTVIGQFLLLLKRLN